VNRRIVTILGVVAGALLPLIVFVVLSIPSGQVVTSDDGAHTVELAMLTVPVADKEPLVEAPDQFLGVPHSAPEFDTSDLGPELTFSQDPTDLEDLDPDLVLRAAYLGHDLNGDPYYIWQSGSPNLRQMIGQILADFGAVGRFQTSYGTLQIGDPLWQNSIESTIGETGLTAGSISSSSNRPTTFTAEWHALPADVAAVVLYEQGEPLGWQRPISGTAAFQFEYGDQDHLSVARGTEMVALTIVGDVWNRQALFPG